MNIFRLSFSNLRFYALSNIFNVIVLALGIAIIVMLLHVSEQVKQRFAGDLEGIDLVVGAKGSPIQLILSSVFHLDMPTGNIPLKEAEKLEHNMLIKSAIPIALGDNYQGFHIVGTTSGYGAHYNAELAQGHFWTKALQVVLGSNVAQLTQLHMGSIFTGSHGLTSGGEEHTEFPYEVVGILAPTGTVLDRLILTDVSSVWQVHEHHHHDKEAHGKHGKPAHADDDDDENEPAGGGREITALLISYKSPLAAATLPRLVNKTSSMQAASPAFETARLLRILGIGSDTIEIFGAVLLGVAAIGFFVTLFNAVNERRYDIALMRSLGATRWKICGFVLAEGLTLGFLGLTLGLLLGHGFAYGAQAWIEYTKHITLTSIGMHPYEIYITAGAIGLSFIVSLIPAVIAYRVNVAQILSKGA